MMEFKWILAMVIGVIMIPVLLSFVNDTTQIKSNEDISLACSKNTWCNLGVDLVQNGTMTVINGTKTLTEEVEYKVDYTNGKLNVTNTTTTSQAFNVSYNYVGHNYMTKASDRNVAGVIGIGVVLGVLILIFTPMIRKK